MGIDDRRYRDTGDSGEGGGLRRALRRIFVEGDGFLSWSFPVYRLWGIGVRVHLLLVVFAIVELLSPINPSAAGIAYTCFFLFSGFVFVLLHEYGHCFACRWVKGEADQILLWPLGGLASCRPPHEWKASLVTTLGGPAVNVALAVVIGGVLLGMGAGWDVVLFNPLDRRGAYAAEWFNHDAAYWKVMLFSAYATNVYLTLFNMLLPMYPMDCGRVVQELMWAKMGYRKSMVIATSVGLMAAVVVGTYAIFTNLSTLLGIAVFAGFTCYSQKQQLAFMGADEAWRESLRPMGAGEDRKYAAAVKQQEKERAKQAEVDRILAKIAEKGMGSLTRGEKRALQDATERKRAGA